MIKKPLNLHDVVEALRVREPLAELVPENIWDPEISQWLDDISLDDMLERDQYQGTYAELVRAVLYLWNDDLEKAHKIAQSQENSTANYIHAIMHRREPDFNNSKYWLKQVGSHPIHSLLISEFPDFDPILFVDWCQRVSEGREIKKPDQLKKLQHVEIELMYEFVREHALI